MANIKLYGNTWDSSNIYDEVEGKTQKEVNASKANTIGNYPEITAGTASQLIGSNGEVDKVPYSFRKTGGDVASVGTRLTDKLVGGSIVWNQLCANGNFANTSAWSASANVSLSIADNIATLTMPVATSVGMNRIGQTVSATAGHKYLISFEFNSSVQNKTILAYEGSNGSILPQANVTAATADAWQRFDKIVVCAQTASGTFVVGNNAVSDSEWTLKIRNFKIIDLTQMFSSAIADYIYGLETAHAGDGVAYFKSLFSKDYYAYNAGTLMSVNAASHEMSGKNLLDPSLLKDQTTFNDIIMKLEPNTTYTASTNIPPNSNFPVYFKEMGGSNSGSNQVYNVHPVSVTTDANGRLLMTQRRVSGETGSFSLWNVQIELGSTATAYEPYEKHIYPLDSTLTLRGIPKLDSNNKLYYDGDTYESDGTVTRKYGVVDLGALTWHSDSTSTTGKRFWSIVPLSSLRNSDTTNGAKSICKFDLLAQSGTYSGNKDGYTLAPYNGEERIYIYLDAYKSDTEASFKTAMSGVYLVYELATPTTESAAPYTNLQICDPNGTEEYVDAGNRDVAIPVGHETTYHEDLVEKIEETANDVGKLKTAFIQNEKKTPQVVLNQLGVKIPFNAKTGDKLLVQSVSGENMTVGTVRFYNANGTETGYWSLSGYGVERNFTYSEAECSFAAIVGGTVQDIIVYNFSSPYFYDFASMDNAVDELNYFTIATGLGFVNRKLFHAENGDTIRAETLNGSTFTVQTLRLYDKTQTQLTTYSLTGYGSNREVTLSSLSSPVEYIDVAGGTAQNIKVTNKSSRYADIQLTVDQLEHQMDGTRNIQVEIGSMSAGKPSTSTAYVRSKDFIKANKGDVLTLAPKSFGLYYGCVYLYSTDDESGYTTDFDIPTVSANSTWTYTFTSDCYFKFRASNASSGALITPADLYEFDSVFVLSHLYNMDEVFTETGALAIDYDTLNTSLSGKFNLAIQTDTHMSDYVGYSTNVYPKSDFKKLQTIVNSINKLDVDVFANLGDFIRGYQFDPDFENRATIDKMINCYAAINTYKAYVIGNHDDGCLFYTNTEYNDNPLTSNVLFPTEQFNRITKFGINNKGKSNYYYEDVNGVRIITLYQRDFDYSDAVPQIESFKIGSEQISWFTNTALDTELPVIILTHAPLVSSLYATSRVGFDDILTAINGFVSNGGTVIAVLSGHTHSQATAKVDGINHIVFDDGYTWFDLVSVDLTNKTISCKAINNTSVQDLNLTY